MPIQIVCAWCGKPMGTKPGQAELHVSHSICPQCAAKVRDELNPPPSTKSKEEK